MIASHDESIFQNQSADFSRMILKLTFLNSSEGVSHDCDEEI